MLICITFKAMTSSPVERVVVSFDNNCNNDKIINIIDSIFDAKFGAGCCDEDIVTAE